MRTSALAGIRCADPLFREWVSSLAGGAPVSVEDAAEFVRIFCIVASRRDLDTDQAAAERFHDMRRRYIDWRDQQQPQRRMA